MSLKDKFNNFIDYFTETVKSRSSRAKEAAGAETQSFHSHSRLLSDFSRPELVQNW